MGYKNCFMKRKVIFVLISAVLCLAACTKKKLPYGRELSEFSDEKVNIGYEEAMAEYEGYLDNVKLFEETYGNNDYDGDGVPDRILKYFVNVTADAGLETKEQKMYVVCFGNGNYLEIGPFEDNFTGIELYGADLTGDGSNEIIFCGEHIASTYPQSGSEIALWTLDGKEYKKMPLTGGENLNSYKVGYPILIEKTAEDHEILVTCKELDLEQKYLIPEEYRELFDSFNWDLQKGEGFLTGSQAWKVSIEEGEPDVLYLYETFLWKVPGTVQVKLKWNGSKFEVIETKITGTF